MVLEIFSNGFFPNGFFAYLVGGILIGLGMTFVYLTTGITAGVSRVYTNLLSFISKDNFFNSSDKLNQRSNNLALILGLVLGAVLFTLFINGGELFITKVSWISLLVGGILVGIGVRYGRGCTSGHGICGTSALNISSIIATIVFLIVGIITALFVKYLGGLI